MRPRWGRTIFRFVFASLHRHDGSTPIPTENYLFQHARTAPSPSSTGCVKRFTAKRVSAMSDLVDAALANNAARAAGSSKIGLLADGDNDGVDPDRLLEFYRATRYSDRWDNQPFTYTPKSAAAIVPSHLQASRTLPTTSPDECDARTFYLNHIIGASSMPGHLYVSAEYGDASAQGCAAPP